MRRTPYYRLNYGSLPLSTENTIANITSRAITDHVDVFYLWRASSLKRMALENRDHDVCTIKKALPTTAAGKHIE